MGYLTKTVFSIGVKWAFAPIQKIQSTVPKSYKSKSYDQIHQKPKQLLCFQRQSIIRVSKLNTCKIPNQGFVDFWLLGNHKERKNNQPKL